MRRLIHTHLRDLMSRDFSIVSKLLAGMLEIIDRVDSSVKGQLEHLPSPPLFGISWILTWFSHDVTSLEDAQIWIEELAAMPPIFIIYACAAVVLLHRDGLGAKVKHEEGLHQWLKELPAITDPIKALDCSYDLYSRFPPCSLTTNVQLRG